MRITLAWLLPNTFLPILLEITLLSSCVIRWLMIFLFFPPRDPWVEHCVEFQKTNGSLNGTSENATSPVIEFWE